MCVCVCVCVCVYSCGERLNVLFNEAKLRAATKESQKTRNKKQNGLAHSRFIVCVTPKQKITLLDSRIMFKRNMCETANQQNI